MRWLFVYHFLAMLGFCIGGAVSWLYGNDIVGVVLFALSLSQAIDVGLLVFTNGKNRNDSVDTRSP